MNNTNWITYYAGLGIYAVCLAVAALPVFSHGPSFQAMLELVAAAVAASLAVALYRGSPVARALGDPKGMFAQSLLGIAVCGGLYSALAAVPRPEVLFTVFLLWSAVGLMHLTPLAVLTLFALHMVIFLNASASALFIVTGADTHGESIYMILLSTVMAGFMYWRALDYTRVRREKASLREENVRQAGEIEDARRRIHHLTVQDMDTIALKYPYFKEELRRTKERADATGETFTVGLVAIDHIEVLSRRHGDTVMKQLAREAVQRIFGVLGNGFSDDGRGRRAVGKVGEGLFGVIMVRTDRRGADACAERLHAALSHKAFRTFAGPLSLTITVAFAEYFPGQGVDELMQSVGRCLENARLEDAEPFPAAMPARKPGQPSIKAATGAHDLRLLHEKEYENPIH